MFSLEKIKKKNKKNTEIRLPKHIAIIMDGNGRWAKKRGMARSFGHKAGAKTFRKITDYCSKIGIKCLTVYAFSTENWKRPDNEVSYLMNLFEQYLKEALEDFRDKNIRVIFLGEKKDFSVTLQRLIDEVEKVSKDCTGMTLNIAMNYGGRAEIVRAVKAIAKEIDSGKTSIENIDEDLISSKLYTKNQPDPDLIIRPSGEYRISNFLTWQSVYSELLFMNILWPDFKTEDLDKAIMEYSRRNRRFGGI